MKETILVLVFSFFFALSIWKSSVLKERVENLLQDIEFYKRRVLELDRQMMQLEQNPAVQKGKREAEIQRLKGKLDFLEKEKNSDCDGVNHGI